MSRTAKKIDESKLSELPVYERHGNECFRFIHYFGEDRNLDDFILPELKPLEANAYDIAKLAISMHGENKGTPSNAEIESAVVLLYECSVRYERKRQKMIDDRREVAEKLIDINELMAATGIDSKKTLHKIIASVIGDEFASRCTAPNSHPCILKNGKKKTIGSNGLISQGELMHHLKHR